ncbi:hypothetical protein [Nocardia vinacea]|uniref:hypothetical protein n=1 Tax=Nocardia vinacea TaxID=96468 RepID=UPI00059399E2|nr:hypothetical protein [Nocardia vinacea]
MLVALSGGIWLVVWNWSRSESVIAAVASSNSRILSTRMVLADPIRAGVPVSSGHPAARAASALAVLMRPCALV